MRLAVLICWGFLLSSASADPLSWVRVSDDGRGFVLSDSQRPFVPWGFNYDHDAEGRLIEQYWDEDWPRVTEDFQEMKALGANVIRIHLQFGSLMQSPTAARPQALQRLTRLLRLGDFIDKSREHAAGWIGFYWGQTPDELRPPETIPRALTLGWLELFQQKAPGR